MQQSDISAHTRSWQVQRTEREDGRHADAGEKYLRGMSRLALLAFCLVLPVTAFSQHEQTTSTWWKTPFPAHLDTNGTIVLRNANTTFGRKMLRGGLLAHGMQGLGYAVLAVLPSSISGWNDDTFSHYGTNMARAYTSPPVFDKDHWYINYIGHPYQGAAFYNAVRSQNAKVWQSSLFTLGHVLLWEYAIEAGLEQPSIQDLIVTPLAGIVLGEGIHRATVAMARNGFRWYEVTFVVLFNPMFALNNGFRSAPQRNSRPPLMGR